MKLLHLIIINFCIIISTNAFAGKEGHGGYGVLINNKPYLLDLVEAGVESDPYFNMEVRLNNKLRNDLTLSLYNLKLNTLELDLLVRKLTEIEEASPILAFTYFAAIKLYNWKLINRDLNYSPDFSSVINVNNQDLIQLANRKEQYIRINENLWSKLDASHKVALIFHEMTYAFITQKFYRLGQGTPEDLVAQSAKARDIIGYLFSIDFKIRGIRGFRVISNSTIPFDFTTEKIDIFNHAWIYNPDGYVLKRGILKVTITPSQFSNVSSEFFLIDLGKGATLPILLENQIENFCERLEQSENFSDLTVEIKTDSLKDVIIKFAKGGVGSHLIIEENKPMPELKVITSRTFRRSSCKRVLMKEVYLKNRYYTPVDMFLNSL